MQQAQGSRRVWFGLGLALSAVVGAAYVAFGLGSSGSEAHTGTLATEAELASRVSWLAAQGSAQQVPSGSGGRGSDERTTRTAERGAGIVLSPEGAPVPGATLVLYTRPAAPADAAAPAPVREQIVATYAADPSSAPEPTATQAIALSEFLFTTRQLGKARVRRGGWVVSAGDVAAEGQPTPPQWTVARTWKADAEGRFALEDLPEGELLLDAHDGQRTLASPLARHEIEGALQSGLRLALVAGHVVEGLVRDGAGLPLAGVEVSCRASAWEDGRVDPVEQRTATTDATGAYRLAGLRLGARYQLAFAREHYFSAAEPELLEVRRDEKLDHVLTEHATLAGTVLEGGVPLAGAEVELRGFGVETSDASGRFRFRPRIDAPRTVELFARSGDCRLFAYLGLELDIAAKREDLALRLERACVVRGRVVDETGRGVGGATMVLQWEERTSEAAPGSEFVWGGSGQVGAESLVRNVRVYSAAKRTRLGAVSLSFSPQVARRSVVRAFEAAPQQGAVEALEAGSFDVDSDGKLDMFLSYRTVGLSGFGDEGDGAAGFFDARRSAEADAAGRFEFLGVWPGRYQVSATHVEHLSGEARECVLAAGDECDLDLVLPRGAKVSGSVVDAEGRPATNTTVIALRTGDEQQRVQVDDRGRFQMVGLSPGELDLVANAPDEGAIAALRGLALANGSEIGELVLRLGTGAGLFGRVVDGMGAPIVGATVMLHSKLASSLQHQVETGADGSYRIERALHGEHALYVRAEGYLPFELEGLALDGMLRREVTLERGATLSGTIYGPDGAPLAGALIFLFHGDEEDQASADDAGRFRFEGLRPGTLQVYVRAEDYSSSLRVSRELALGEDLLGFDLRLRPSGVLRGVVRDAAGKPVAGIEVNGQTEPGGKGRREATTGSDGRFELRSLYPDHYRVYAGGDPSKGLVIDARAGGELEEIELVHAR